VGFSSGGAYDMGKYVPGNPAFMVQNMTGGGSMVAANYVYNVAKPDGLTFGLVTLRRFSLSSSPKFSWIGSPEKTERIFFIRRFRRSFERSGCGREQDKID
jgi:tripartite-type tricarboxylate transporter receptor subunit TctC